MGVFLWHSGFMLFFFKYITGFVGCFFFTGYVAITKSSAVQPTKSVRDEVEERKFSKLPILENSHSVASGRAHIKCKTRVNPSRAFILENVQLRLQKQINIYFDLHLNKIFTAQQPEQKTFYELIYSVKLIAALFSI